jgi:hypothetical protein
MFTIIIMLLLSRTYYIELTTDFVNTKSTGCNLKYSASWHVCNGRIENNMC